MAENRKSKPEAKKKDKFERKKKGDKTVSVDARARATEKGLDWANLTKEARKEFKKAARESSRSSRQAGAAKPGGA